jgi:hypothetical protein
MKGSHSTTFLTATDAGRIHRGGRNAVNGSGPMSPSPSSLHPSHGNHATLLSPSASAPLLHSQGRPSLISPIRRASTRGMAMAVALTAAVTPLPDNTPLPFSSFSPSVVLPASLQALLSPSAAAAAAAATSATATTPTIVASPNGSSTNNQRRSFNASRKHAATNSHNNNTTAGHPLGQPTSTTTRSNPHGDHNTSGSMNDRPSSAGSGSGSARSNGHVMNGPRRLSAISLTKYDTHGPPPPIASMAPTPHEVVPPDFISPSLNQQRSHQPWDSPPGSPSAAMAGMSDGAPLLSNPPSEAPAPVNDDTTTSAAPSPTGSSGPLINPSASAPSILLASRPLSSHQRVLSAASPQSLIARSIHSSPPSQPRSLSRPSSGSSNGGVNVNNNTNTNGMIPSASPSFPDRPGSAKLKPLVAAPTLPPPVSTDTSSSISPSIVSPSVPLPSPIPIPTTPTPTSTIEPLYDDNLEAARLRSSSLDPSRDNRVLEAKRQLEASIISKLGVPLTDDGQLDDQELMTRAAALFEEEEVEMKAQQEAGQRSREKAQFRLSQPLNKLPRAVHSKRRSRDVDNIEQLTPRSMERRRIMRPVPEGFGRHRHDLEEWMRRRNKLPKPALDKETKSRYRKIYEWLDADGSGTLDIAELKEALQAVNLHVTEQELM